MVFPYYLKKLDIFQPRRHEHAQIACQARITLKGIQQVSTDLSLFGPDGKLWMRLKAWEDKRFDLPPEAYAFLLSPIKKMVSAKWQSSTKKSSISDCFVSLRMKQLFHGDDEFWLKVFAYLSLSKKERTMLQYLDTSMISQKQWLTERLLVKDAVRTFLKENFEIEVGPVDIAIEETSKNLYAASGFWAKQLDRQLVAKTMKDKGWYIATAMDDKTYPQCCNVGVIDHAAPLPDRANH